MRVLRTPKRLLPLAFFVLVFALAGCGTLEVELERTPTPDLSTAVVAALEQQNQALNARVATLAAPRDDLLTVESDSESIRRKLLFSASRWSTIWADAGVNTYPDAGQPEQAQTQRVQLWASQDDGRFRLVWSDSPAQVDGAEVSDGQTVRRLDVSTGQISGETLPAAARQVFIPPEAVGDSVVDHPLARAINSPLADQLFSSLFGQRRGVFTAQTLDVIAGRDALVVDWAPPQGSRVDRLWVDVQTGVVLRWQNFGKTGGERIEQDIIVNAIQYDAEFPSELFDQQLLVDPYFAGGWEGNPEPAGQTMAEQNISATDEQGELYFYIRDPDTGAQQMVSLPGSCLDGSHTCPEPQPVKDVPTGASQPFLWSPTGEYGLLISAQSGTSGPLLRYDPREEAWRTLAESARLAAWSPDGRVIAYATEKDVYLILAEGGGTQGFNPRSMIARELSMIESSVSWLAWQDTSRLLVMISRPSGQTVYLVDVATGTLTEVLQRPHKGGTAPEPSPDGQRWAMVLQEETRSSLLVNAAGAQGSPTISFYQSTIWPVSWSPDGKMLAFNVYRQTGVEMVSDLYVASADGTRLQQIHRGSIVPVVTWSPDGRGIVVESSDELGRTHLMLVQIESGQSNLLQAPGLNPFQDWITPSWRK